MERREIASALSLGLLVHPVAAVISLAAGWHVSINLGGYLFASAVVAIPLLIAATFAKGIRAARQKWAALRWATYAFAVAELVLQLAAQLEAFRYAHTDAQAGLAFLFLPIYAHAAAFGVAVIGALGGALLGRRRTLEQ